MSMLGLLVYLDMYLDMYKMFAEKVLICVHLTFVLGE